MSTSGLGRGLGSLLEPKDAAAVNRPSSRGFGVLIGDAASKAPGMPAERSMNTDHLVSTLPGAAPQTADVGSDETFGGDGKPVGAATEVRWMWRPLLVADLLLVAVAAWILLYPSLRQQRGAVVIASLLMGVGAILGLLCARLSR